ncbi:hypothetical protein [Bradyrhizobium sp. WSM1417]|uniref:hypothetical protein n=1 Tax=Bradyrhizobium sp. WSM1417 TaxID=754500 RepID=UPI0012EB1404|nr:hypothetical protein [Bradyrhizobium sp. WSM1417]
MRALAIDLLWRADPDLACDHLAAWRAHDPVAGEDHVAVGMGQLHVRSVMAQMPRVCRRREKQRRAGERNRRENAVTNHVMLLWN